MNTSEFPICDACGQASPVTSIIGRACICESCRPAVMAEIAAKRERGEPVSAMAIAQDLRLPEERGRFSPSVAQIRAFLEDHGLTGAEAAKLAYLSGR